MGASEWMEPMRPVDTPAPVPPEPWRRTLVSALVLAVGLLAVAIVGDVVLRYRDDVAAGVTDALTNWGVWLVVASMTAGHIIFRRRRADRRGRSWRWLIDQLTSWI